MITKKAAKHIKPKLLAAKARLDANLRKIQTIHCDLEASLAVLKKARKAREKSALDHFLKTLLVPEKFTVKDFTRWITRQ